MTKTLPAAEYEQAIMDAHGSGESPPDVEPEAGYAMSPAFQAWMVSTMRDEVMSSDELGAGLMGAAKKSD